MADYERDQWLKENAPDPGNYNADSVKALMKIAYEAGRKRGKEDQERRTRAVNDEWNDL